MLDKLKNYRYYEELVKSESMSINVNTITVDNWDIHFLSLLNVLRDGIETDTVQKKFIKVVFDHGVDVELAVPDYMINLIMWRPIIHIDTVRPEHLFFESAITRKVIKIYIDTFIITPQRGKISNMKINNIIDDMLKSFKFIDEFSFYLCNTINLEDDIRLMREHSEVREIFSTSLADVPINEVNTKAMELTNKLISYITNSDHCMKDYFLTKEGIKPKQFKEYAVSVGPKPDGRGNIFPAIIDSSFINGGLQTVTSLFIESSAGRTAQILSKNNVGDSGHFARLLGLNNSDTFLHRNPDYICDTANYEELIIRNGSMLQKLKHRYYKLKKNGIEHRIDPATDMNLIGKMVYLRSPITCASHARGEGICYRCYGDLAHTNSDINIGKISTQLLSSILTQILLSAKHLLEAAVQKIEWSPKFDDVFAVDMNIITLLDDLEEHYTIIINRENIHPENEEDNFDFNEFLTEFEVKDKYGKIHKISSNGAHKLYLTEELNMAIRKNMVQTEDIVTIESKELEEQALFVIKIHNNELSKTLDKLKNIIDLSSETSKFNRHEILQEFLDTVLDGNLSIDAIHCEVIISNQLRDIEDILETPQWEIPDVPYRILTLHQSLSKHPSLVVGLSFQDLSRQLYNPLTHMKRKTSLMDAFFHTQPQTYMEEAKIINEENTLNG